MEEGDGWEYDDESEYADAYIEMFGNYKRKESRLG
jgi:hypothetical protein